MNDDAYRNRSDLYKLAYEEEQKRRLALEEKLSEKNSPPAWAIEFRDRDPEKFWGWTFVGMCVILLLSCLHGYAFTEFLQVSDSSFNLVHFWSSAFMLVVLSVPFMAWLFASWQHR